MPRGRKKVVPSGPIRDEQGAINDMGFGEKKEKPKSEVIWKNGIKWKVGYSKSGHKYYERA